MRFYLLHFLQSYYRDEVKIVLLVIFPMFGVYRPCHDRGGSFISGWLYYSDGSIGAAAFVFGSLYK